MFTHSFRDTFPPARFDDLPWTRVLIEQSADGTGGWVQIDDQAIAADATPASPDAINITVATATLERAWFRFRFRDAAAALSPYTSAVLSPSTSLVTLEGLKRRMDKELDVDDDLLADDLAAALAQAQKAHPNGCGRLLAADPVSDSDPPVTRRIVTRGRRVAVPDAREITAVTVDDVVTTGYETLLKDGLVIQLDLDDDGDWFDDTGYGRTRRRRVVQITGRFGFAELPVELAGAIYALAARWSYERGAMYADQVEILEGAAVQSYYRQVPPRVKLTFSSFALPTGLSGLA